MRPGWPTRTLASAVLSPLLLGAALAGALAEPEESAASARPPAFSITGAASEIRVDGVLDEPAWAGAMRFDAEYEWFPEDNVRPPVRTEFLATYDDRNLYAAWICHDPEPSRIRAHLMDRDQVDTFIQDDHVLLMIDPFNDERRGFQFRVNPLGVQADAIFSENEGVEDFSYDMIWASSGRITPDGYVVEIAIPLNQIRFPRSAGPQTWGFDIGRSYPRSVRHRISAHPVDRNKACVLCQVLKVTGFENIKPGRNIDLAPTLTVSRYDVLPERGTSQVQTLGDSLEPGPTKGQLGATLRWGITPSLTFSGAANPDFSQVEADAAQLTVNKRFALFYPEKRPFFLEGIDLFTTPLQAVFTRTVFDPDWGLKFTGKEGRNAFGVFATMDTVNNLVFPTNQASGQLQIERRVSTQVLRYRRDVGRNSSIGLLYTGREGDDYHNRVGGIDAFVHLSDSDRLRFQYLRTDTQYPREVVDLTADPNNGLPPQPDGAFGGRGALIDYTHGSRRWFGEVFYKDLDASFRADSGFIPRVEVREAFGQLRRSFWGSDKTWYTRIDVGGDARRVEDHDRRLTDETLEIFTALLGPLQSQVQITLSRNKEFFADVLHEPLNRGGLFFSIQPSGVARITFFSEIGNVVDYTFNQKADEVLLIPTAELKLGRHVNLQIDHTYQRLDAAGERVYTVNLSQLRLVYNLNLRAFFRGIVQYQDLDMPSVPGADGRDLFYQLLFAYKLNPQSVIFAGYSDTREATEAVGMSPKDRTFFLKLGYIWSL